jgi:tripartite-type tricarboxylate transporter receptor subunit TctC
MPSTSSLAHAAAAGAIALALHGIAAAQETQDIAEFYRGKTLSLVIAAAPDSEHDLYARLVARHLGRFVPGNPKIAASNMPGAGGHLAAAHLDASAAKDGTAIAALRPETITEPLWQGLGRVQHDPARFIYLGSAKSDTDNCFIHADRPIRSLRDALAGEVVLGATRESGPTRANPALLNNLLGSRFRLVATFAGTREILQAMERGDVAGVCGLGWSSMSAQQPDWIPKGVVRVLVQESVRGNALASKLGAPLAIDFARSGNDRELMALAYRQQDFALPYVLPAGTPAERAAALRQAFRKAFNDGALRAEAKARLLDLDPLSGEDVQALVEKLYATPPQLIERVRSALTYRPPR